MKKLLLILSLCVMRTMQTAQMMDIVKERQRIELSPEEEQAVEEMFDVMNHEKRSEMTKNERLEKLAHLLQKFPRIVNIKDKGNYTMLQYAVWYDDLEEAQLLIAHGADVNTQNKAGTTPLMRAAQRHNFDMIKLLVAHGANIMQTNRGSIARDYAGDLEINKYGYDVAVAAGLKGKQYREAQAAALMQHTPLIEPLVEMITDYSFHPNNREDLPTESTIMEIQQANEKETENRFETTIKEEKCRGDK